MLFSYLQGASDLSRECEKDKAHEYALYSPVSMRLHTQIMWQQYSHEIAATVC